MNKSAIWWWPILSLILALNAHGGLLLAILASGGVGLMYAYSVDPDTPRRWWDRLRGDRSNDAKSK